MRAETRRPRQLTNLALLMTGLHLVMLLLDADAAMSLADLVIPFASGSLSPARGGSPSEPRA